MRFSVDERLAESRPRTVGVNMPVPLHERIDQLCDLVYDAGFARPSKWRMLSALVLGAPVDPTELDGLVRAFDRARVADALITVEPAGNVVEFPRRRSGPRTRSGG